MLQASVKKTIVNIFFASLSESDSRTHVGVQALNTDLVLFLFEKIYVWIIQVKNENNFLKTLNSFSFAA